MNFLSPIFLLGMLAVIIPLVIHFINLRRPKKVAFSSLTFLSKLKQSTIRRIRIKEYLLMALRIGVILILAAALARPFLPPTLSGGASSGQPQVIGLLIDNSSSTSRIASGGPLIDQATRVAESIIDGASGGDRFFVATTNGNAVQSKLVGKEKARGLVQEIEPTAAGNYTAQNYRYLREAMLQSGFQSSVIYIITDGQQTQFNPLEDVSFNDENFSGTVQLIKLEESSQQNTAVTSIELKNQIIGQGGRVTLQVSVKNMSETPAVNQFISLTVGGRMAGQYEVVLDPGQSKNFLFEVNSDQPGDVIGQVTLEGDEVSFDNRRNFVVRIPEMQRALFVDGKENTQTGEFKSYLKPALQAATLTNTQLQIDIRKQDEVNSASFGDFDVIILDGLQQIPEYWFTDLQQEVQNGKGVLFFPSEQGDILNYNRFLELFRAGSLEGIKGEYASFNPVTRIDQLSAGHPVLNGLFKIKDDEPIMVDQPVLFFLYQYKAATVAQSLTILDTETGDPVLTEHSFGEGKVLVSTIGTDPGWSNFPVNPLFAPLFYRSVLYAASGEQGKMEEHVLNAPFRWQGNLQDQSVVLELNEEEVKPEMEVLPNGVQLIYSGREWTPGILYINSGNAKYPVAVNQNIMESDFDPLTGETVKELLQNSARAVNVIEAENAPTGIKNQLETANFGKEIWNWFLWAAFVLLIIETLVSKLYKAEKIS